MQSRIVYSVKCCLHMDLYGWMHACYEVLACDARQMQWQKCVFAQNNLGVLCSGCCVVQLCCGDAVATSAIPYNQALAPVLQQHGSGHCPPPARLGHCSLASLPTHR